VSLPCFIHLPLYAESEGIRRKAGLYFGEGHLLHQGLHFLLKGSFIPTKAPFSTQGLNYSNKGSIFRTRAPLFQQGLHFPHKSSIIPTRAPFSVQGLIYSPAQ